MATGPRKLAEVPVPSANAGKPLPASVLTVKLGVIFLILLLLVAKAFRSVNETSCVNGHTHGQIKLR
jgi:hypothetical protein